MMGREREYPRVTDSGHLKVVARSATSCHRGVRICYRRGGGEKNNSSTVSNAGWQGVWFGCHIGIRTWCSAPVNLQRIIERPLLYTSDAKQPTD